MSKKYYRVLKDNFLWEAGAILELQGDVDGYRPYERTTLWDKTSLNNTQYITARVVENCPEYFEQVYKVNLIKSVVFKAREEARKLMEEGFN